MCQPPECIVYLYRALHGALSVLVHCTQVPSRLRSATSVGDRVASPIVRRLSGALLFFFWPQAVLRPASIARGLMQCRRSSHPILLARMFSSSSNIGAGRADSDHGRYKAKPKGLDTSRCKPTCIVWSLCAFEYASYGPARR
jgi:hypothetical protein